VYVGRIFNIYLLASFKYIIKSGFSREIEPMGYICDYMRGDSLRKMAHAINGS
jgi:hypothetical protein